jgi:homoserine dehydrogenase
LEAVDDLAEEGYYIDAMQLLSTLSRSFKGTDVGDKARAKHSSWKKDKKIKLEITVETIITKTEEFARLKQYKKAHAYLQAIVKSNKYAETKSFKKAEKLSEKYRRKMLPG